MHLPIKFSRHQQSRRSTIGNFLTQMSVIEPTVNKENIVHIDISIESEEQPVINLQWKHSKRKSFDIRGESPASVRVEAGIVKQASVKRNRIFKQSQATDCSDGMQLSFWNKSVDLDRSAVKSSRPLNISNINSLGIKKKISIGSDCEKPATLCQIRNIPINCQSICHYDDEKEQNSYDKPQFQRIDDQLKNMDSSKAYRYRQLISKSRRESANRGKCGQQLAFHLAEDTFRGCVNQQSRCCR